MKPKEDVLLAWKLKYQYIFFGFILFFFFENKHAKINSKNMQNVSNLDGWGCSCSYNFSNLDLLQNRSLAKQTLTLKPINFLGKKNTQKTQIGRIVWEREREREREREWIIDEDRVKTLKKRQTNTPPIFSNSKQNYQIPLPPIVFRVSKRERESLFYLILCDMLACADLCGLERLYLVLTHR